MEGREVKEVWEEGAIEAEDVSVAAGKEIVEGTRGTGGEGETVGEHRRMAGLDKTEMGGEGAKEAQWEEAVEVKKKECEAEEALEVVRVVEANGDVRGGLSKEMGRNCRIRTGECIRDGGRQERTEVA